MLSSTNAFFLDLLMPGTSGAPSLASASPVDRRTDFGYIDADRGEKLRISSFFSRSRCPLFYRAPAHYLREMSASDKLIHINHRIS